MINNMDSPYVCPMAWLILLSITVFTIQVHSHYCYFMDVRNDIKTVKCFDCPADRWGSTCSQPCSKKCRSVRYKIPTLKWPWGYAKFCDSGSANCFRCDVGRYGPDCSLECSDKCDPMHGCAAASGHCFRCKAGYYGPLCASRCSPSCRLTIGYYVDNSCYQATGDCEVCAWKWTGNKCSCKGRCSHTGSCLCTECAVGFYGDSCSKPCSVHCSQGCDRKTGYCESCKPGWFGASCGYKCPEYCYASVCDRTSGDCSGCMAGWSGARCTCQGSCDSDMPHCYPGYYGSVCDKRCPYNCGTEGCDRSGVCRGCIQNYYQDQCDRKCGDCLTCDQQTGKCLSCHPGHFGHQCEAHCSTRCLANVDGDVQCDFNTGHCLEGCLEGYIGDKCQDPTYTYMYKKLLPNYLVASMAGGVITTVLLGGAACCLIRCIRKSMSGKYGNCQADDSRPPDDNGRQAVELTSDPKSWTNMYTNC
ncbi:hypothetical protein ScPMuIL_016910 [Solemya velum]